MGWYAVHVLEYIKLRKGHQDVFPVTENVLLIEADSPEDAQQEAIRIGKDEYETGLQNEHLFLNDRPAVNLFGGVRKVVACNDTVHADFARGDEPFRPGHGTEITFSRFQVDSEAKLLALLRGDPIDIWYEA